MYYAVDSFTHFAEISSTLGKVQCRHLLCTRTIQELDSQGNPIYAYAFGHYDALIDRWLQYYGGDVLVDGTMVTTGGKHWCDAGTRLAALLCSAVQCSSTSSPTLPSILPSHPPLPCLPLSRELSDGSPHLPSYSVILLNEDYPPIPPPYQQVLHPELKAKPHFHHCLEQMKHQAPL